MLNMRLLVLLALVGLTACHVRQEQIAPNRCLPGQNCFPNRLEMKEFAATLTGKLVQPFDAEYSSLVRNVNNRATRHPALIVLAGDVADVQKAMKFARKWQLMVTSQADTKDVSGRGTYDGSLNINLSQLNAISSDNSNTTLAEHGSITAQAGAIWEDVYTGARVFNKDVVAPNALKAAVGGTVGDGGVGPLVKIYGLVSDNLVEAKVVLADGSIVTVQDWKVVQDFGGDLTRQFHDRQLMAALTAGGVGPWGVVVEYTFQMKPAPAGIVRVRLQYTLWEAGDYVGQDIMNTVTGAIGALPQKWGGYVYVNGGASETLPDAKGGLIVNLFYYGLYKADSDYDFIDNFLNLQAGAVLVSSRTTNETGVLEFEQNQPNILGWNTGGLDLRWYGFNTLLQTIDPPMDAENEKLTEALLFALNNPTVESAYFCTVQIMGGQVATAPRYLDLVNPAVRSAYASLSCQLVIPGRGIDDSYYVSHAMDFRKLLSPFGHGKIHSWAEEDVTNWKEEFHGSAYGDLIETKLRYDVDNYLWCHNCVGSDFRVNSNCDQKESEKSGMMASGGHHFLEMGNKLGGYVSNTRFRRTKMREMSNEHKARLVYINQMAMENN